MMRHIDEGLLNDLEDGLLDPESEAEVRAHLEVCPRCQGEFEALANLLEDVRGLPQEAQPARDLWPQIAWRMEGTPAGSARTDDVASGPERFPAHTPADTARHRLRVTLPAWQLLAASIALVVVSGGSVWAVFTGLGRNESPIPAVQGPAQLAGWEEAYGGYDEAVADLEALLEQGRDILGSETVQVLEENLRTIDTAIKEAREALVEDPASAVLQRFLAENMRKKVDLLRQAAGAVLATT